MLAPALHQDTLYCLTSINEIQNNGILSSILENVVFSVDLFPSWYKYHFIYLYPYQITDQKDRLRNIRYLIRSISRCNINKRKFSLWIWSAIISDCQVLSILENKWWDFIVFKNWTIISKKYALHYHIIQQKLIFDNWVFQNSKNKIDENDFIAKIFNSQNKKGELFYFNFKEGEQIINLFEKYVLFIKKTNSFSFYLQRKFRFLISYFNSFESKTVNSCLFESKTEDNCSFEYKTENNCINIQINSDSDSYSLLIKIKQLYDTEEYFVREVWNYIICTMCINILQFLKNWRVNMQNYFISSLNHIKTKLNNSGIISQEFIEYVKFKDIDSESMLDFAVSLISLSKFSSIFISQTHNILRSGWVQLKRRKLFDNLNVWVRKLILGNIF